MHHTKIVLFACLALSALVLPLGCKKETRDERVDASLSMFVHYHRSWEKHLARSIEKKGTAGAIEDCSTAVAEIKSELGAPREAQIRRVSDRARSPVNEPDAFEARVLAKWQEDLKNGKTLEITYGASPEGFRVMKPILMESSGCLRCHGAPSLVEPEVLQKLKELYPEDKALGYNLGDLRGAFSAIWAQQAP